MAIKLPSGFKISVQEPIDNRLVLTKAEMAAILDAKLPSNYLCVCKDDGKLYIYNVNNTISAETGKFRLYEGKDYQAGDNIQINGNVISATDTKYTAGTNITIDDNNVISAAGGSFDEKTIVKGSDDKYKTAIGGWKETTPEQTTELFVNTKGDGTPTYLGPSSSSIKYDVGWDYNTTITSLVSGATTATINTKFTVLGTTFNGSVTLTKSPSIPANWESDYLTIGGNLYKIKIGDGWVGINQGGLGIIANPSLDISTATMESLALVTGAGSEVYHPIDNKFLKTDNSLAVDTDNNLKVNTEVIQPKLTAGTNIDITNNVISATGTGLPEGTEAGQGVIYDGSIWKTQDGYGYLKGAGQSIVWDGSTTGKEYVTSLEGITICKVANPTYLPTKSELVGAYYQVYNGSEDPSFSYLSAEDLDDASIEGLVATRSWSPSIRIYVVRSDSVTIQNPEGVTLTKGVWFSYQNDFSRNSQLVYGDIYEKFDPNLIPHDDDKADVTDLELEAQERRNADQELQNQLDALSTLAKTGNVNDLQQTTGDLLILNCNV